MPRSNRFLQIAALTAVVLVAGCSQERDAWLNRTYHGLTARDNGWFNGNEKLKEIVMGIEDAHMDDFDQVLPLFVYGTEEQARAAKPDLDKCIDKCSLVIERHSMDIEGKEKNRWIDDAYFVIAKSQFYMRNYSEAERGFTHISRRFKGQNRELESEIWLARTAINMEQFAKAQSALDHVRDVKKLPKGFDQAELGAVQAELELKRGKVDDAIMQLEYAVPITKNKRQKVRWAFILAQLYELKGKEEEAIRQYAAVVRMNPPYELAFHAQIYQALAFNKGDTKAMRKKLNRMLRDDKHIDHFDMIHYALADLDLKDQQQEAAIAQLETSVRVSTTDTKQKAKSFLKLADLYFDDRKYQNAQQYYDSTQTLLAETHARFEEVRTRARVLGDLVEQLNIIQREDSLQKLMGLSEEELTKKIRDIIRERELAEAEKERLEEEARSLPPDAGKPTPPGATPGAPGRGSWYFYDPQQIGRGLANFRKRWGNRKLEDDWRRGDKSGSALAESVEEEGEDALAEAAKEKEKGDAEWKDPSFYTKDIPRGEEALAESNAKICEALYTSGMIYKEQLKDRENGIESFEVLNNRFEECRYTAESHYQLYRIYLEKEQEGWVDLMGGSGSEVYKNIILERWPDSEFARLVRDPNMVEKDEVRKREEEFAYKEVYQQYRQYAYGPVIAACTRVLTEEPRNHFRPKYHILKAMAIGGTRDISGFRAALGEVKSGYPGTDEARAADELLAALDGREGAAPPPRPSPGAEYSTADGEHFYAVVVPNEGSDVQRMKEKVSDFNRTFFRNTPLEVTSSFLNPENQVLLLSGFNSKAPAMEYHTLFMGNADMLAGINDQNYPAFAISSANYAQLFKSKDVAAYQAFFIEKYIEGQ